MTESPQLNQVELDSQFGFASDDDSHVPYMKRTRDWYMALGYNNPYRYAHYIDVPFQPLKKALSESTVTLMTTAAPFQPDKGPQGPGAAQRLRPVTGVPHDRLGPVFGAEAAITGEEGVFGRVGHGAGIGPNLGRGER